MEGQWGFYKRRLSNYIVKRREECIRSRTDIVQRQAEVRFGVLASVRVLLVKLKETIQYDNYSEIYTYIRKHQRTDTQILRHIKKIQTHRATRMKSSSWENTGLSHKETNVRSKMFAG